PLVLLNATVVDSLEQSHAAGGSDYRAGFQIDVWAVVVRADQARTIGDGRRADDRQNDGAVAAIDNQARTGFDLCGLCKIAEAGGVCGADDFTRRGERRARRAQI